MSLASTAAQRAAIRILQSIPRDCIRTHQSRSPMLYVTGQGKPTPAESQRVRQWILDHKDSMTFRQMADELGVPKYCISNHLRVLRGYVWNGKRKR